MMYRLIYVSTALDSVDLNEFKRILNTAQTNNAARDLTGMLAFNSKVFLQAIEGSREAINDLYAKLTRDQRHFNLMLLKYSQIEQRHWANWSMGFAAPSADNRALFLKYSNQSTFNPYGMLGDNAEKLLMELSSNTVALEKSANEEKPAAKTGSGEKSIFARFLR
jgi:hypothetical protein